MHPTWFDVLPCLSCFNPMSNLLTNNATIVVDHYEKRDFIRTPNANKDEEYFYTSMALAN